MDICCLCLPNTPFSGNSTHLFHLGNHWSPVLRACGSESEEWVGTRFRPGQTIQHPPETCDLSWANGSLARTLTGTPEKRLSLSAEILKLVEGKLASREPSLTSLGESIWEWSQLRGTLNQGTCFWFLITWIQSDPPLVFLVMWAEPPLRLIQFELSFKTCKAESWLIPPPSL